MSYNHFKPEQRNELAVLLRAGLKQNKIAILLEKSEAAISQELKRNPALTKTGYSAGSAKEQTKQKRIQANQIFRKIENNKWLRNYIIKKTKKSWSPEQISGRLKKNYKDDKEKQIHILTHVERKSGMLFADKLERGTAENTNEKTISRFSKLPKNKKHTITYDNGSTFSQFEMIEKFTGLSIYFAWPYHSWERGCNENANGLLRQFFPKKSFFASITQEDIDKACKLINNRPRKRLGYLTPNEVFNKKIN